VSEQKICPTCGTEYPLSERFCPRDGSALRSANAQGDLLGSIIADRYHILKKLGEGGMGTVYLAEHVKMGRKSALKVMNPGMNTDPDAIARFNREASNASRLSHPNICGIYDFGETPEGMIYLAMEFIEGTSLTSLIETAGHLPAPRAAAIIHQTADALQVAHDAGIVHRDLKPDNIMVAKHRDGSDLVKVVDFGIAKASTSDAQKVTKTGLVVGTPEYMSPEQLAGDKLDGRSDIYSLALVAFNCLTGKLPFPAETAQEAMIMRLTDRPRTLAEMRPEVSWPAAVQVTLDRALEREASARYQSASEFGRDLAQAIAAMPVTAAAEAGTMVLDATRAAPAQGAKTAPMPATRVSRGARTVALEARGEAPPAGARSVPAAPAKAKSPLPMVLGGVGGVAAIGVVVWQMGLIGGGAGPTNGATGADGTKAESSLVAQGPNPGAGGATQGASGPSGTPGGTTGGVPSGGGATKGTPASGDGRRTDPGPTGGDPAGGSTGSPPSGTSTMTRLEGWLAEVQDPRVTRATARRVVGDVQSLQPSLRDLQLAESHYVEMIAFIALEDATGACRAAKRVLELHRDTGRQNAARQIDAACQ
jgi:eukaryotic-like serine/threonine-protein kinase